MDEFPTRFADFLDSIASRVRAMTVDRVAAGVRMVSLAAMAATLGIMAVIFLLLSVYGALAIPLGPDGAFAVLGLVCLILGLIAWARRSKTA